MRSMDVGKYRHNYEDFYEKATYQMSINRERTMTTHESLEKILFRKSCEEDIQPSGDHVATTKG